MRKPDMQFRDLQQLIYWVALLVLPSLAWADLPRVERFSFNAIFELTNSPEMLGSSSGFGKDLADLERLRVEGTNGDATVQYHLGQMYNWRGGPHLNST